MMATTQQLSVGHRIVGSAKGLTCSTLSGVSGVEAELRNCLDTITSGKFLAAPQTLERFANRDIPKTAKATRRLSEGFRGDFTKDVDLDPDFEAFARRTEPIELARRRFETRPARKAVLVCDFSRTKSRSQHPGGLRGNSPETVMRVLGWRQTDAQQSASDRSQISSTDNDWGVRGSKSEMMVQPEASTTSRPTMESTWERSQSAAVERLRQFSNQLTGAAATPLSTKTSQQDWIAGELHWEEIQNQQMRERLRVPERRLKYERPDATEPDHLMRNFYCRRLSCHRRLLMQEATLNPSRPARCCVHTGCGYVSQTIAGWERHCATEHNHMEEIDYPSPIP
ncbi:hypothetical protein DOTSEDRAFT_68202 [Dothistroma septosporum NZE10]|uniref:Uncharacterized protein n=1 Tax=Dothistroma septosporum (strain NZE10 / CBS 128990) TaxID=675120 RepID=N1Q272_DOTSN|nr:hypothetical protein DOTSEDRAFT_68202 [Dothistroma septosporum NZE10]